MYIDVITTGPQSINTTINSTVNFTCIGTGHLFFLVNDTHASLLADEFPGFMELPVEDYYLNETLNKGILKVVAFVDNNNTGISCVSGLMEVNGYSLITSDKALMLIQGKQYN